MDDIKYRNLKVNGNTKLLKLLYQTDGLDKLNNRVFNKVVAEKEDSLAHQVQLHLAGEKENEVKLKNRILK